MNIQLNKNILSIFFCAFALIALSACGSDSSDTAATPPPSTDGGDPDPMVCMTDCDPVDPTDSYVTRTPYLADDRGVATNVDVDRARYKLSNGDEIPANAILSTVVTAIKADAEYQAMGSADQIHAAYAYARGHTGEGVIVSIVQRNNLIDLSNDDLSSRSRFLFGYKADGGTTSLINGRCQGSGCVDGGHGTHIAGIIVGRSGNVAAAATQGIAYDAKFKPIDIFTGTVSEAEHNMAILEATMANKADCDASVSDKSIEACNVITVMNNGWDKSTLAGSHSGYKYKTPAPLNTATINAAERTAWETAVATTVVVFAQGDNGHNSENGMVKLYNSDGTEAQELGTDGVTMVDKRVAWKTIEGGGGDLGTAHARLASTNPNAHNAVKGSWLSVIALEDINPAPDVEELRIADFSNGCGDAKAYCLGAPGVSITSALPGDNIMTNTGALSGTAQAAAHVSAAIAVLKSAAPTTTVENLVKIILNSADDLGVEGVDDIYGHGALNLARAIDPMGILDISDPNAASVGAGVTLDNSGITLPTSFGGALDGFTVGFIDDYKRAYIGSPTRITQLNAAFTLGDTIATWDSPELQTIALDSNSKMQFTNYDESEGAKDTLIFTHNLPNHTIGFSYNEESKSPDLRLTDTGEDLHFQKIRPIANDLMQVNSTHKLGKNLTVKNAITTGEFDTGNRFNEAMANLNYTSENRNLTIGAGTLKEYGQFLGASGTGAYQLSDATQSTVTHLAISQNLPLNSAIKLKYTNFKTEVDMRYNNFANINDLTADEYQLSFAKKQVLGKNDSLNLELIQPFAVTDGNLQQNTVLGYTADGDYNNVTQNYSLKPETRRQQLRMTWQNQLNNLKTKTKLFISMQYENHVNNLRDNNDSQILGGISTKF